VASGNYFVVSAIGYDGTYADEGKVFIYSNANNAPIATANTDLSSAYPGQTVTLDGSDSIDIDGDDLMYTWIQNDSSGYTLSLYNANTATSSFTIPSDMPVDTVFAFELIVNDTTQSSFASLVTVVVTDIPVTVPDSPTALTSTTISDSEISLSWVAPNNNGGVQITGYTIERESPSGVWFKILISNTGQSVLSFNDVNLSSFTEYNYRVSAINGVGTSIPSNESSATTIRSNVSPTVNNIPITTDEDNPITISLNGTDADGDSLLFSIVTQPLHGIISAITSLTSTVSSVVYTPTANTNGVDSFTYIANDGEYNSDNGIISITINPINDAPVATNDYISTDEDVSITISVLSNDSDIEFETSSSDVVSSSTSSPLGAVHGVMNTEGTFVAYYEDMKQILSPSDTITQESSQPSSIDLQLKIIDDKLSAHTLIISSLNDELKQSKKDTIQKKADYQKIKLEFADIKRQFKVGEISKETFLIQKELLADAKEIFLTQKESFEILKQQVKEKKSEIKEIIANLIEQRQDITSTQQDSITPSKEELKKIKSELKEQRAEFKNIKESFQSQNKSFQSQKESLAKQKISFAETKKQFKAGEISKETFQIQKQSWNNTQESFQKVIDYNEDDCIATRVIKDWLVSIRWYSIILIALHGDFLSH